MIAEFSVEEKPCHDLHYAWSVTVASPGHMCCRLPIHPFTTPRGRSRATFAARLARSHTSATSSTSL